MDSFRALSSGRIQRWKHCAVLIPINGTLKSRGALSKPILMVLDGPPRRGNRFWVSLPRL